MKKLQYTSELIENYFQTEIVDPQKKFQALQSKQGLSLLFSIGSDTNFYVTKEKNNSKSPWVRENLSETILKAYEGQEPKIKTFSVAQNISTGNIDIALVISTKENDFLYVSLDNQNTPKAIAADKISWTLVSYDATSKPLDTINIQEIYLSETRDTEYLIVDLLLTNNFTSRYFIHPNKSQKWESTVIGGQLNKVIGSCLGQVNIGEGMYNLGNYRGTDELFFLAFENPFDHAAPPTETSLNCPVGAEAISAVSLTNDNFKTALFVAGNGALHYFSQENQTSETTPVLILKNELFTNVTKLFSYESDGQFIIWGLNRSNTIFYTSCAIEEAINPESWSVPVPILNKVDQVSPFINLGDSANTFFVVNGNTFKRAVQSPTSTIWNIEDLNIAHAESPAKPVMTYMSSITYTDENNLPLANTKVYLSADSKATFYINQSYYVLDKNPIPIKTNSQGKITIIEKANGLNGNKIYISDGSKIIETIDPTKPIVHKLLSLDTVGKLQEASIQNVDGTSTKLIPENTDLSETQKAIVNLKSAYNSLPKNAENTTLFSITNATVDFSEYGVFESISEDIGNVFSWLSSGVDHTIQVLKDKATGVWHFVVKIAGKIYHSILDGIHKIVGAFQWIFNKIKVALKDLWDFLKHLFDWKEIWKTHEILASFIENGVSFLEQTFTQNIGVFKSHLDHSISNAKSSFSTLETPNFLHGKSVASSLENKTNVSIPSSQIDWVVHNLAHCVPSFGGFSSNENPLEQLTDAFKNIFSEHIAPEFKTILGEEKDFIENVLQGKLSIDTVFKILKQLGQSALEIIERLIDSILGIIEEIISYIKQLIREAIAIPFISDIYQTLSRLMGKSEKLTVINATSFLLAIPVNSIFETLRGEAPFKNGSQGIDDPKLFTEIFSFLNPYETFGVIREGMNFKEVYTKICHPVGGTIKLVYDALSGVIDFANIEAGILGSILGVIDIACILLAIELPEDKTSFGFYISKWLFNLIEALAVIPIDALPEPLNALAALVIDVLGIVLSLPTDIGIIVEQGADNFKNWLPLLLDSVNTTGNIIGNLGLTVNGASQLGVVSVVGVELAAIIPFAIVIGGAGLALAAIADTTGLITEIVMD